MDLYFTLIWFTIILGRARVWAANLRDFNTMTYVATPDDFDDNQNLEDVDPEEVVLGERDRIKINGKPAALPGQPLLDYTRERVEGTEDRKGLQEYIDVNPDYSNFQMEDLTFVLQDMDHTDEDTLTAVQEQSLEDGEIFERMKDRFQNAVNPGNIQFSRCVTFPNNWAEIDTGTEVKIAKTADNAGNDVYMAIPLTPEEGKSFQQSLKDYIERMEKLEEETDEELKIVPVLHLVDLDKTAGEDFADEVADNLSKEKFRFIGVTGSPIYTNKEPFRGVRNNSDRKLLVSNCPKKVFHTNYDDVGKMSRQELYRIRGADVVLQERSIMGAGESSNKIELLSEEDYHFEDVPVRNAESPISEQLEIQSNRRTLLNDNNVKVQASGFINEILPRDKAESLRDRLQENVEEVYSGKPYMENALAELINPQ